MIIFSSLCKQNLSCGIKLIFISLQFEKCSHHPICQTGVTEANKDVKASVTAVLTGLFSAQAVLRPCCPKNTVSSLQWNSSKRKYSHWQVSGNTLNQPSPFESTLNNHCRIILCRPYKLSYLLHQRYCVIRITTQQHEHLNKKNTTLLPVVSKHDPRNMQENLLKCTLQNKKIQSLMHLVKSVGLCKWETSYQSAKSIYDRSSFLQDTTECSYIEKDLSHTCFSYITRGEAAGTARG